MQERVLTQDLPAPRAETCQARQVRALVMELYAVRSKCWRKLRRNIPVGEYNDRDRCIVSSQTFDALFDLPDKIRPRSLPGGGNRIINKPVHTASPRLLG